MYTWFDFTWKLVRVSGNVFVTSAGPRFCFSGGVFSLLEVIFYLGWAEVLFLHFTLDVIVFLELFEGISVPLIPFGGGPA